MSTNYGRTNEAANNQSRSNVGSQNQIGMLVSSVPAGIITQLNVYVEGDGGTSRVILCLWDSSGTLLAQTAQITTGVGSSSVHGQALQSADLVTPYVASSTADYYVGFWRNPSDQTAYSYLNSGGTIRPIVSGSVANVGSPGALSISTSTTGQLTAYLEWNPAGAHVYNGSSWEAATAYVYNGSAWEVLAGVYVYNGSSWELVS